MIINEIQFNCELEDILEELKSQLHANEINLLSKMKDNHTHIQVCCPYHAGGQERRPSAGIRKEDGLFHCFACGEVHFLQEVISHCFGYTDDIIGKFGWQWLLKNFATVQVEERKDVYLDFERYNRFDNVRYRRNNTIDIDFDKHNNKNQTMVSEEELETYRYYHNYMYKRGLTNEVIELFDIGYDCDTECITFPVRDIRGRTLFIARRSIKSKFFHYPKGVEKPLYGLYEINQKTVQLARKDYIDTDTIVRKSIAYYPKEVIVCESMLDALSFWTVGKYAVALNGLGNELQFKQLRDLPCRKIILATDMDERGLAARKRIRMNMKNTKIVTEYIFPKGRKDANECTKEELMNLEEVF